MQGARALKIDIYQAIVLLLLIFVSGCFVGAESIAPEALHIVNKSDDNFYQVGSFTDKRLNSRLHTGTVN